MKRSLILAVAVAVLLVLFLMWRNHPAGAARGPDSAAEMPAATDVTNRQQHVTNQPAELAVQHAESVAVTPNQMPDERSEELRTFEMYPDIPISFYGLVVDQDSNALQNVKVALAVTQWDPAAPPGAALQTTNVDGQTGIDGRFSVGSVNGHGVTVLGFTKDGYEPEFMRMDYGEYGSHGGSPEEPIMFRMWSTNLHQPLISANKSFPMIPDGRHYAIDLVKGTITEGDEGDLVAWVKRPEKVKWRERYEWLCELTATGGGLCESRQYAMFNAPEAGYTNSFSHRQEANSNYWGDGTGDKRFYLKLRNGQMYGRVTITLFANEPSTGLIRLSYAVNPSGSRLLR